MERIKAYISKNPAVLGIIAVLMIGIPLTLFLAKQNQDLRQKATYFGEKTADDYLCFGRTPKNKDGTDISGSLPADSDYDYGYSLVCMSDSQPPVKKPCPQYYGEPGFIDQYNNCTTTNRPTPVQSPTPYPTMPITATPTPEDRIIPSSTPTPRPTVTPTRVPTSTPRPPSITPTGVGQPPTATPIIPTSTPRPTATPTRVPTSTPRPSITPTRGVTPSLTPRPSATVTPVPSETPGPTIEIPTPSVTSCPVPGRVSNVQIECPFCNQ
jgi:hypothetical protein